MENTQTHTQGCRHQKQNKTRGKKPRVAPTHSNVPTPPHHIPAHNSFYNRWQCMPGPCPRNNDPHSTPTPPMRAPSPPRRLGAPAPVPRAAGAPEGGARRGSGPNTTPQRHCTPSHTHWKLRTPPRPPQAPPPLCATRSGAGRGCGRPSAAAVAGAGGFPGRPVRRGTSACREGRAKSTWRCRGGAALAAEKGNVRFD